MSGERWSSKSNPKDLTGMIGKRLAEEKQAATMREIEAKEILESQRGAYQNNSGDYNLYGKREPVRRQSTAIRNDLPIAELRDEEPIFLDGKPKPTY